MNKVRILITILIILVFSVIVVVRFPEKKENENKKASNNISEKILDTETYNELIEESKSEVIKNKVLNHMNSGKYYHIQKELEHNGKTYRIIQMCNFEYVDIYSGENPGEYRHEIHDMLYVYYSTNKKLKDRFDMQLEEKNLYEDRIAEECGFEELTTFNMPSVREPSIGDKISFYRNKDFGFMEESSITALLSYDSDGEIYDIKTFHGATGIDINETEDGKLVWEVYIAEKLDYYLHGAKEEHGPTIHGWSSTSGTIYDIYINNKEICDIKERYKSSDNNWENTTTYYEFMRYDEGGIYVKHDDLSIYDIINWDKLYDMTDWKYDGYQSDQRVMIRDEFGKDTIFVAPEPIKQPTYITKEGYIIRFVSDFCDKNNKKEKVKVAYIKLTAEEYLNIEGNTKKWSYLNKNEKPLVVDGEINPELLKELEGK